MWPRRLVIAGAVHERWAVANMSARLMADEHLRQLERRWRETGSVEDEAAYLMERLRAGSLSRERLDLAAYCGHAAARLAGGATPDRSDDPLLALMDPTSRRRAQEQFHNGLRWWCLHLRRWGPEVWARAVSTALRVGFEARPELVAERPYLDRVAVGLRDWGRCPCPEHLAGVREFAAGDAFAHLHVRLGENALEALVARNDPILFGPFEALEKAQQFARFATWMGALNQLVERGHEDHVLLLHDCGPSEFTVRTRLASFCRALSTGTLTSPTLCFLDAARATSAAVVEQAVRRELIDLALTSASA